MVYVIVTQDGTVQAAINVQLDSRIQTLAALIAIAVLLLLAFAILANMADLGHTAKCVTTVR